MRKSFVFVFVRSRGWRGGGQSSADMSAKKSIFFIDALSSLTCYCTQGAALGERHLGTISQTSAPDKINILYAFNVYITYIYIIFGNKKKIWFLPFQLVDLLKMTEHYFYCICPVSLKRSRSDFRARSVFDDPHSNLKLNNT